MIFYRQGETMKIEIAREDYELLSMLLSKEEVSVRVEIHHCRTRDFKEVLKKREQHVHGLLARLDKAFPAAAAAA
jgi:stress response protein YsnF